MILIIPKGYHNLPKGQTSFCNSKTSHFREEMHHFPGRENITGRCKTPVAVALVDQREKSSSSYLEKSSALGFGGTRLKGS